MKTKQEIDNLQHSVLYATEPNHIYLAQIKIQSFLTDLFLYRNDNEGLIDGVALQGQIKLLQTLLEISKDKLQEMQNNRIQRSKLDRDFKEVAREQLTKDQYNSLLREAKQR